jgi:hypothetical protein
MEMWLHDVTLEAAQVNVIEFVFYEHGTCTE